VESARNGDDVLIILSIMLQRNKQVVQILLQNCKMFLHLLASILNVEKSKVAVGVHCQSLPTKDDKKMVPALSPPLGLMTSHFADLKTSSSQQVIISLVWVHIIFR